MQWVFWKDIQSTLIKNQRLRVRKEYLCWTITNSWRWYWAKKENVELRSVGFRTWGKWVGCRTSEVR